MGGHYNIMVAPDAITLARIINPVLLLNSTYSEMQVHKTWRYDCVKDFNTSLKCLKWHTEQDEILKERLFIMEYIYQLFPKCCKKSE